MSQNSSDLTERQREIVEAIQAFVIEHGYPPSYRDLTEAVGVNLSTVQDHLARLRDLGVVTWEPGQFRTLRVLRG